jgi:phage FluMu gp28-like protein
MGRTDVSTPSSIVPLYPYQRVWIDDETQCALALKGRQLGFTWGMTLGLVLRCLELRERWYYLSINEERAKEAIELCQLHLEAMGVLVQVEQLELEIDGAKFAQLTITLPGGSKIIGLPANPRTARGCSGNVVLDEFAHHQDAGKIWTALFPVITRGHKLRVISTPNGKQGKFYELWTANGRWTPEEVAERLADGLQMPDRWSRHRTDIYQAVAQGFPADVEALRELAGSEDLWQQEYCCAFLDEAAAWLPYSLIETAYHPDATLVLDATRPPTGPLYAGMDVARKRDLTVVWVVELVGDVRWTRAVLTLQRAPFAVQRAALWDLMPRLRRACIDANGIGAQIAEETEERWPSKGEGVSMNGQVPAKIAAKVKHAFEQRTIRTPDDHAIRQDLHSVRRTFTEAGNVRFEAPRGKDGHADRFWALGLALEAQDGAAGEFRYEGLQRYGDGDAFSGHDQWAGY